jgi:hypothetical protein
MPNHDAAEPQLYIYTSNKTGSTYALNTTFTAFAEAEITCNGYGGHLVAWKSVTEQQEVEGYYLRQGYLLPTYHDNYWMGLNTSSSNWPRFNWTERTIRSPGSGAYQHWGRPEGGVPEPNNNRVGLCAVCNASLSYTNAWGWADTMCNMTNAFICRMQRKSSRCWCSQLKLLTDQMDAPYHPHVLSQAFLCLPPQPHCR